MKPILSCLAILIVLGIGRPAIANIATRSVHGTHLAWRSAPSNTSGPSLSRDGFQSHSSSSRAQHVWYLLAIVLALASQSLLIGGLFAQRARWRRAEEAVRARDSALRRSFERIGHLAGQLIDAQETVRTHIARDLHDDVAQRLSLLAIDLSMLEMQFVQLPSSAHQRISEMSTRAAEIGSDLHRLSHELHPALLEELGLEVTIRSFCRELSNARHLDIDLTVRDLPHPVTPDVALCVYRVAQEALHNVARHSGASSAMVTIERNGEDLILTVTDCGAGFDVREAHEKDSLGLRSIEERVDLLDGDFLVWSKKGEGTHIEARVPLQPRASASLAFRSSTRSPSVASEKPAVVSGLSQSSIAD